MWTREVKNSEKIVDIISGSPPTLSDAGAKPSCYANVAPNLVCHCRRNAESDYAKEELDFFAQRFIVFLTPKLYEHIKIHSLYLK